MSHNLAAGGYPKTISSGPVSRNSRAGDINSVVQLMRKSIKYSLVSILLLPVTIYAAQLPAPTSEQIVHMELYEAPDVTDLTGYGNCQWLYPLDSPKEPLVTQPICSSAKPVYYAAVYGDADDNIFTIIIDESKGTGTGYDIAYVDSNNDNRIDALTEKHSLEMSKVRQYRSIRSRIELSAGDSIIPYYFSFTAFSYSDQNHPIEKIHATCRDTSIFIGNARFDGKMYKVALADLDTNGLFNDPEQGIFNGDRFFVDFNEDGSFTSEGYPCGKYTNINGKWYSIVPRPDGTQISISPAQPELAAFLADGVVKSIDLRSPQQSQKLNFDKGSATAITGEYNLALVELSAAADGSPWICRQSFRAQQPKITITTDKHTKLPAFLPLSVAIKPKNAPETKSIGLNIKITTPCAAASQCPAPVNERPKGAFEIQDRKGNIIIADSFEYG
jgi:hypothetical protein